MVALSAAIAAVGWVGFFGQRALANNDQWVGGGDGASFNSAGNWNINALPGIPASNDSLEFLGVSTTQNLNDNLMTPTTYNVSGITFDASTASGGSYTIASSGSNGFTLTGNITDNDPTNVQTINDLIALSGTRTTTVTSGGILSLGGLISGSGSWVAAGAGTVNFAGANSYTGTTNASAGIINASNLSSFGNYNSATGGLIVANSAVVNFMATSNIASLSGTSGAATVNVSSGITLTTGYGNTSTGYAGAIIGSGNFAQFGSGTQTLSGTSSYTGTTSIQNSGGLLNLTGTIGSFATPTGAFNVNVASGDERQWRCAVYQCPHSVQLWRFDIKGNRRWYDLRHRLAFRGTQQQRKKLASSDYQRHGDCRLDHAGARFVQRRGYTGNRGNHDRRHLRQRRSVERPGYAAGGRC
jgi:autotransporter-associated beta strand protein